jgi:hypothetical protein
MNQTQGHPSTLKSSNGSKSTDNPNKVRVGNMNAPLSPIDRLSSQKIKKESSELLHTLDQIDMVDIYRVFHPTTQQYTFFSVVHGTFSKIDHILGNKASLNNFKKIEITPCIIPDHNGIKLDLNNRAITQQQEIKGIQIGKKEIKLPLFADDMILYLTEAKISPKNY